MNICVFGAASDEIDPSYLAAGRALGLCMARRGHTLLFGAGKNGLMGAVAAGVTANGGRCIGVVPEFLASKASIYPGCAELIRVSTMRERKRIMEERADAFIVTPGGIGTYEEFFEVYSLRRLGQLDKPIALLNTNGFFDAMNAMLRQEAQAHFLPARDLRQYRCFTDCDALLDDLEAMPRAADRR